MSTIAIPSFDARTVQNMLRTGAQTPEASRDVLGATFASPMGGTPSADEALEAFQNVLVRQMLQAMRESIPESGLFPKSTGEEIFESFLDDEYARELGRRTGHLGLTEVLKTQLGLDTPETQVATPEAQTFGPVDLDLAPTTEKGESHS